MTVFFTSDMHFFHNNIISHAGRPFSCLDEMHTALVERWNSRVGTGDIVWILGDVSFGGNHKTEEMLNRLNGTKNLILGNHDYSKSTAYMNMGCINQIQIYEELSIGGKFIVLFHYPISDWNGRYRGNLHLHGHLHSKTPFEFSGGLKRLDVGVDAWNYYPVSLEEVLDKLLEY